MLLSSGVLEENPPLAFLLLLLLQRPSHDFRFFSLTLTMTSFYPSASSVNRPGTLSLDDSYFSFSLSMPNGQVGWLSWSCSFYRGPSELLSAWPLLLPALSEAPSDPQTTHIWYCSYLHTLSPGHTPHCPQAHCCTPMSMKAPFIVSSAFWTAYRLPVAQNHKPTP